MRNYENLVIVGIAGSYGKTTMKEAISAVLSQKLSVLKTPENINTPLGISQLILEKLHENVQVFVVEMGEYYRGDIQDICSIVMPDISVVTGINEAHLERLGSLRVTTETIFEIVQNKKKEGFIVINADDIYVRENYKRFVKDGDIELYSSHKNGKSDVGITDTYFHQDGTGLSFTISYQGQKKRMKIPFLGDYIFGVIRASAKIGLRLGLTFPQIVAGIGTLSPFPHRLQPIQSQRDVLIIDDSYNGNPNGVEEAIQTLEKFTKRRKLYVTPGLVEIGEESTRVHQDIGRKLGKVAHLVLLVRNSVTPYISKGLEKSGFDTKKILWFENASVLFQEIQHISRSGDVILFQNDWPENYL